MFIYSSSHLRSNNSKPGGGGRGAEERGGVWIFIWCYRGPSDQGRNRPLLMQKTTMLQKALVRTTVITTCTKTHTEYSKQNQWRHRGRRNIIVRDSGYNSRPRHTKTAPNVITIAFNQLWNYQFIIQTHGYGRHPSIRLAILHRRWARYNLH